MLARDIKVKSILKQRSFIKNGLSLVHKHKDGDPSYPYAGHLYPENKQYFEDEGLTVRKEDSEAIKATTNGLPIWVFTPNDMVITLTEEEMEEAKKYEWPSVPTEGEMNNAVERTVDLLEQLFGISFPEGEEDDEAPSEEEDLEGALED